MNEFTDAEKEEITKLKRQLALSYAENAALRGKEQPEETEIQTPGIMEHQTEKIQREFESVKDTIAIGRQALDLERTGIPYSIALKIAEATHAGDYDTANKLMQIHEQNERTANLEKIREQEEKAMLRKAFGLK